MAGRRKITFEQASAIKALGKKGMKAGPIARLMGCPQGIVEDILAERTWRAGVQNCQDCNKQLRVDNRSGYCRDCLKNRCAHCKQKLPVGRGNRRCKRCKADERAETLARGDRLCTRCHRPLFERRDHWCGDCRRAYNESRKLTAEPKPDGRRARPLTGICSVCREPCQSSLCRSCAVLANTYGMARVKGDTEKW